MKRILVIVLTLAMFLSFSAMSVSAETGDTDERNHTITYTVASTYTVTIPQTATFTEGQSTEQTISVSDIKLRKSEELNVILQSDFTMSEETTDATVGYTVTKGTTEIANNDVVATFDTDSHDDVTLKFTPDTAQYAGTYTDTVVFTIDVKKEIGFTIHSVPVKAIEGMTWAEWIESEYNTIGIMIDTERYGNEQVVDSTKTYVVTLDTLMWVSKVHTIIANNDYIYRYYDGDIYDVPNPLT